MGRLSCFSLLALLGCLTLFLRLGALAWAQEPPPPWWQNNFGFPPFGAADGQTRGLVGFAPSNFNDNGSGIIDLDFTNGQKASALRSGFLSATDWAAFNAKIPASRLITTTPPLTGGGSLATDLTLACPTCATAGSALTANLPVIGAGGQGLTLGSRTGTTTAFVTFTGTPSASCAQFDATGNLTATGSPCTPGGTGTGNVTTAGILPANRLVLANGGVDITTLGTLGTDTTLLHGNALGAPTFGPVNLATEVTGILAGGNGGTGNGAMAFTGPTSTIKTFILPNSSATILTSNSPVTAAQGGTGANNVATTSRYLKGDGTNFVTSNSAASGVGSCTNLFVTGLNSDASPTCTAATLTSAQFANQGTTATLLHGNASGNPSFGPAHLASEITGNLPIANLNSGTGATSTTFWRGDGTWATPTGAGDVTDVGSCSNGPCFTAAFPSDTLTWKNASASGTITLQTVPGSLGTQTLSLPAVTDTFVSVSRIGTLTNKALSGASTAITNSRDASLALTIVTTNNVATGRHGFRSE